MEIGGIVKAVYDFPTDESEELPLHAGDIIQVKQRVDKQWCRGICNACEGNFPSAFTIEVKVPHLEDHQRLFAPVTDFVAQEPGDLSFKRGELIVGDHPVDSNWWEGQLNGNCGIFPITHVWKIDHVILPKAVVPKKISLKARVKMNMKAQLKEEMDLTKDEIVFITEEVEKGWYRGECNGKCGIFPASFVAILSDQDGATFSPSENSPSLLDSSTRSSSLSDTDTSQRAEDSQYGYDCLNSGITAYGRTIYPFTAEYRNELSFCQGEIVNLIRHVDEKWMEGEIDNRIGIFPKNFVDIIVDCPSAIPNNSENTNLLSAASPVDIFPLDTYGRVLFDFQPQGEIKLNEGDTVTLARKIDQNWYEVVTDDGEVSICPTTFIELIGSGPDSLPPSYSQVMEAVTDNEVDNAFKSQDIIMRDLPTDNALRYERPFSYPSSLFDQSIAGSKLTNKSDFSFKLSSKSIDDKIAESLFELNSSVTSQSSNNHCSSGDKSHPQHGSNTSLQLGKSYNTLGRVSPFPFPTVVDQVNGKCANYQRNSSSDASLPSYNNNILDNVETSMQRERFPTVPLIKRTPARPPPPSSAGASFRNSVPFAHSTLSSVNSNSTTQRTATITPFIRQSSVPANSFKKQESGDIRQKISQKEAQMKRLAACRTKLENEIKTDQERGGFVITEINQQINQLTEEIEEISKDVVALQNDLSIFEQQAIDNADDESSNREIVVARKRQEEEQRRNKEKMKKMKEQRDCVVTEILQTERDYISDLRLLHDTFLRDSEQGKAKGLDVATLFGNLDEVIDMATRFLKRLEKTSSSQSDSQMIGECFVDMSEEMKEVYGHYCRNHDDVNAVLDKYNEKSAAGQYLKCKLEVMKHQTNCFDLPSMLIKPVQRILKYPLLLNELAKSTEDGHPDKQWLIKAIGLMTDVATAINEFKRRKDLVFKYRKHADTSLSGRISKLSLHSMLKKSSRFGMRLSNSIGLTSVTKDESFETVERKFNALEKSIKIFLKDMSAYTEKTEELVKTAFNMAEDIAELYQERKSQQEVDQFRSAHRMIVTQFWEANKQTIDRSVSYPLKKLLETFHGPTNLIQKRYDKLLDFESCTNKLEKNKDATKIKMFQDNQQMAKNTYEALNSQLLDDLPKLCSTSIEILRDSIYSFLRAKKNFIGKTAHEMLALTELSLLLGSCGGGILETFQVKHTLVTDSLCQLAIVPKLLFPTAKTDTLKKGTSPRIHRLSFGASAQNKAKVAQNLSQQIFVKSSYPQNQLYSACQNFTAVDLLDISLTKGDVVGVVKQQDPMGSKLRWFVDDGAIKGFVPAKILVKCFSDFSPTSLTGTPLPYHTQRSSSGKDIIVSTLPTTSVPQNNGSNSNAGLSYPQSFKHHSQLGSEKSVIALQPVRPAPPVYSFIDHNSRTNSVGPLVMPNAQANNKEPMPTTVGYQASTLPRSTKASSGNYEMLGTNQSHRYEEIGVLASDEGRYDMVSQEKSLIDAQENVSKLYFNLPVGEFDPCMPQLTANQLYDNVPNDEETSDLYNTHRYEVIPEDTTDMSGANFAAATEYYYALYDFLPTGANQLKLTKGQVVFALHKCDLNQNSDWWFVEDRHGNKGYVPGIYLNKYSEDVVFP